MQVIPAINETSFAEVKRKIELAAEFSEWVHIDIADGKFTPAETWNKPEELKNLQLTTYNPRLNIEVHLMVESSEGLIGKWLDAGVDRVIVHLESLPSKDLEGIIRNSKFVIQKLALAINPETSVEKLFPYLNTVSFVQTLAVNPGWAGQEFNPIVLDKIKLLKEKFPNVTVEVDGGINIETAKLVKDAGADVVASASYIFGSADPRTAFDALRSI